MQTDALPAVPSTALFGFLCTNQHAGRFEQRVKVVALLGRWAIIEALQETMLPGRQVFLFAGQQAKVLRSKIRIACTMCGGHGRIFAETESGLVCADERCPACNGGRHE